MEDPNTSFSQDSGLKGLSKFETGGNRGLLRISIQNLLKKPDMAYHVYLVGQKESERNGLLLTKMGTLIMDSPGCYSYLGSFNPRDLDGNSHGLHDFHSILIAAETFQGDKIPILRGHLTSKAYPITYEMLNPDPYQENRKAYCLEALKTLYHHEKISPFGDEFDRYEWRKVETIDDFPLKDIDEWLFDSVRQYHHYLLGSTPLREGDAPHFWLIAIPGKHSQGQHLENFFWKPLSNAPQEADGYGYHICGIDFLTGQLLPRESL